MRDWFYNSLAFLCLALVVYFLALLAYAC
jgi:hypothetical protein